MKKLLILVVALFVMLTVAGFAQDMSKDLEWPRLHRLR
jgi:hypothetical protein